jgi:hypothetical protein
VLNPINSAIENRYAIFCQSIREIVFITSQ